MNGSVVDCVCIVGAAQLDDNLAAADLEPTAAHIATLDDASAFELGYTYDIIQTYHGPW